MLMMKKLKKIISMILTCAMILTQFSVIKPESVSAGVTLKSSTIKSAALAREGNYYPNGYCLKFVEEFYQQLGASRPYSCCASKSGNTFIRSQSRTDIPIGATVYFGNCGGGPCKSCGSRYYGHVGIYVGDGYFVHATGGKVQKSSLSSWANKYRGYGYCGNFNLEQDLSSNNSGTTILLPGTVDSSWNVPTSISASRRITTYDQWGNAESNHYIASGDSCYIAEVYTNGFVKVQYPVARGKRWAYAKASDFSIGKRNQIGKTNVYCTVGSGYTITTFSWDTASNAKTYDLKIWKDKIWQGDAYKIIWDINGNSAQVCLPPGYYEAYVDARNGSLINMSNNVVKFTVSKGSPVNLGTDYYANIVTNKNQLAFTNTNGNVDVRKLDNSAKQIWHFKQQGDGTYTIQNCTDGKYLDTDNSRDANGTNIKVWTYNGSDAQKYYIFGSKQGEYILKPKCATRMVDVCGGNNNPGDNVQLWDFNGGDAQRLYINKTSKPAPAECKHQYGNWTTVKKATCTSNGIEQRICSLCRKTETRTIKATGHKYTNKTIAPTSTTKGYTLHTCSACGYSYKDNYTNVKKQLQSITIATKPSKTTYNVNDAIDTFGLKIIATYTDGSKSEVQSWKIDGSTAKAGSVSVRVSYTESGITRTATYEIQVKEKEAPKETVYVTYNTNGGSMSQKKQSGTKGSTIQLLNERPAKSVNVTFQPNGGDQNPSPVSLSQTFKCWLYNSSTTMSTSYYPGSSLTLTQNCTLYAQYNDAKLTTLPVISREGYVFDGWYTPNNALAYEGMTITSDTVLIARWTETSVDEDDDKNDALAVGDELETDQAIYTITKTNGEYCVEYSELFDDDVTVTYIPDIVAIDGVVYKVTSIGEKAFYKNTALKKIVIGSCVEKISSKAFYGCTSLKNIVINSTKISNGKVGANAFKKVNKNVKVYVPALKYKAYKKLLKKAGVGSKAKIYKIKTR